MHRRYYSVRTGRHPESDRISLHSLLKLFKITYCDLYGKGYFTEAFGFECVDAGYVPGTVGADIDGYLFRKLRKENLWPIQNRYTEYTEDDLFDIIELLYDHVSKPVDGWYHPYNDCGMHWKTFDRESGQNEFILEINNLLADYGNYELSSRGEIYNPPFPGTEKLFEAIPFSFDQQEIGESVIDAIRLFRYHGSTLEDKKKAVRELADVLESFRPEIRKVLTKADDSDLFNIANNFEIRHRNAQQKAKYDKKIWLDWMFYFYLATIHAVTRLLNKKTSPEQGEPK